MKKHKLLIIVIALIIVSNSIIFADQFPGLPDSWQDLEPKQFYNNKNLKNSTMISGNLTKPNGFVTYWIGNSVKNIRKTKWPNFIDRELYTYGGITYGNGYQFPLPPIIKYEAGGETIGKVEYFTDGGYALVRVDQEKRKGGKYLVLFYAEKIKIDNSGFTNDSLIQAAKARKYFNYGEGSYGDFGELLKQPNSNCRYSTVYDNATLPLSTVYEYGFKDFGGFIDFTYDSKFKTNQPQWYDFTKKSVFTDVGENYWGKNSINKAFELGLIKGIGNGKFAPKDKLTKAQVMQLLYNFWQQEAPEEFVTETAKTAEWYDPAVNWAKETGLILSGNNFSPNAEASRGFFTLMIGRLINKKNIDIAYFELNPKFKDLESKGAELQQSIRMLQNACIITGYNPDNFSPDRFLSRAEAAAIMERLKYAKSVVDSGDYLPQSGHDYYYND